MGKRFEVHEYKPLSLSEFKRVGSVYVGRNAKEELPQHIEMLLKLSHLVTEEQLPEPFLMAILDVLLRNTDLSSDTMLKMDVINENGKLLTRIVREYLQRVSVLHDIGKTLGEFFNKRVFFNETVKGFHQVTSTFIALELLKRGLLSHPKWLDKFVKITGAKKNTVQLNFNTLLVGSIISHHEPAELMGINRLNPNIDSRYVINLSIIPRYLKIKSVEPTDWFTKSLFKIDSLSNETASEYFVDRQFLGFLANSHVVKVLNENFSNVVDTTVVGFYSLVRTSDTVKLMNALNLIGYSDLFYLFMMLDNVSARCNRGGAVSPIERYLSRYPHFKKVHSIVGVC